LNLAVILLAALALIAVVALAVVALRSVLQVGPPLVGRTVVVNTRKPDDQTIRGVLHGQYADRWTLRNAVYVTGVGETPAAQLVHVPVANIAFVQEIEPPGQFGRSEV
jgi:hypothetical protein